MSYNESLSAFQVSTVFEGHTLLQQQKSMKMEDKASRMYHEMVFPVLYPNFIFNYACEWFDLGSLAQQVGQSHAMYKPKYICYLNLHHYNGCR